MENHEIEKILAAAQTAKGSPGMTPNELLSCLDVIYSNNMFIHSMETFGSNGNQPNFPLRTYLSILGLDRDLNWEVHKDAKVSRQLVESKIERGLDEGLDMQFVIWLDDI